MTQNIKPTTPIPTTPARPTRLPSPTYWPFFMAMGLAFAGWGLIATWIIAAGGIIIFVIALIGWINNLRHEG